MDSPHVVPLGERYIFRVPKGAKGGRTEYGAVRFHVIVGKDSVHWFGRWDIDSPLEGAMSLHTVVSPLEEGRSGGLGRPVKEPSVIISENILAFYDTQLYLRLLWLKDARGDYAELVCSGWQEEFQELLVSKTVDSIKNASCRFKLRPREDVTAMMQLIRAEQIPGFLKRASDVYELISNAIEDES